MQQGFEGLNITSSTQNRTRKAVKKRRHSIGKKLTNQNRKTKIIYHTTPCKRKEHENGQLKLKQTRKSMITSRKPNTKLVYENNSTANASKTWWPQIIYIDIYMYTQNGKMKREMYTDDTDNVTSSIGSNHGGRTVKWESVCFRRRKILEMD